MAMSTRETFAAAALQGLLAGRSHTASSARLHSAIAAVAVSLADALVSELRATRIPPDEKEPNA